MTSPTRASRTGTLELAQPPQLLHDLGEDRPWQRLQRPHESPVVDRPALVDHHLTLFPVAGDAPREHHAKDVLSRQPGRTREDPGRGMTGFVEKIGLDDQNRTHLARLRADARAEIG